MTQCYPLSPTIFNVVVDAMVRHWESLLVAEREGGKNNGDEGSRRGVRSGTEMTGSNIQKR